MKTLKLNLDDPVTNLTSEQEPDQLSQNNGDSVNHSRTAAEYEQEIEQLQNQIKMMEESLQNAREETFQAGVEEGKEQAQVEFKKLEKNYHQKYKSMLESLEKKFDNTLEKTTEPLLELAYKIAQKIIERELEHKNDYKKYIEKLINKYITEFIDQGELTIQIPSEKMPDISIKKLNSELTSQSKVHLIENSDLEPADCILETHDLKIDARISRQLENLKTQNDNI